MGKTLFARVPRPLASAAWLLLPLLSGCLPAGPGASLSWSPSGRIVAFVAHGRAWLYDLDRNSFAALTGDGEAQGVAWSPREDTVAVSTTGAVVLYRESRGRFWPYESYRFEAQSGAQTVLMWHPSAGRLLAADWALGAEPGPGWGYDGRTGGTVELDVQTGKASRLGKGVGLYAPKGEGMLWGVQFPIGRRSGRLVFERQTAQGKPLPLSAFAAASLEESFLDICSGLGDNSAEPFCWSEPDEAAGRTSVVCLDSEGGLESLAELPSAGAAFLDRRRKFAAVFARKADGKGVDLRVYSLKGKPLADGRRLLAAMAAEDPDESAWKDLSAPAWSPNGSWLALTGNGRLILWNWRNDVVRVRALPETD